MKKLFCILLCFLIIILSSCKDPKQEKCDSESTIEYFLEYWKPQENSLGVNYRFDFNYDTEILKDKDYLIYDVIKDIEYEQYYLSHKYDYIPNADISLIYGSGVEIDQNFILMSDLERVCVYQYYDGHIEFHYSYRYYRIKKEDGLKIMKAVEKLEANNVETN